MLGEGGRSPHLYQSPPKKVFTGGKKDIYGTIN